MYINQPTSPYHGKQINVLRNYIDGMVVASINEQEVVFATRFLSEVHPSELPPVEEAPPVEEKPEEIIKEEVQVHFAKLQEIVTYLDDEKLVTICDMLNKEYLKRVFSRMK